MLVSFGLNGCPDSYRDGLTGCIGYNRLDRGTRGIVVAVN